MIGAALSIKTLAGITQLLTIAMIMILKERGNLSYDDYVKSYLVNFPCWIHHSSHDRDRIYISTFLDVFVTESLVKVIHQAPKNSLRVHYSP